MNDTAPDTDNKPEEPCGLFRRLIIMVYDCLPAIAMVFIAALAVLPFAGDRVLLGRNIPYTLYIVAAAFTYFGVCWVYKGQTLGMRSWKVKVVTDDGARPGWRQAIIRYLAAFLSLIPLGLGFWASLLREDRRCWHDRMSGTYLKRYYPKKR